MGVLMFDLVVKNIIYSKQVHISVLFLLPLYLNLYFVAAEKVLFLLLLLYCKMTYLNFEAFNDTMF